MPPQSRIRSLVQMMQRPSRRRLTTVRGYARVSFDGKSVAVQVEALEAAGAGCVWSETASGAQIDRRRLRVMLAALVSGDVMMVVRLDRLSRTLRDLLTILGEIADKGTGSCGLAKPLRTPPRRMGGWSLPCLRT